MAGLTHHFLLNPLVGQPFLGSEGEDGHDKIKPKRYGSGSGWSALYDSLESILALRSNAGCRPSERQKIEAVSDVLIKRQYWRGRQRRDGKGGGELLASDLDPGRH